MFMAFISCDTFVPDPIDPRLPIYSEVGRNIAGAKVGNQFFKNDFNTSLFGRNLNESQLVVESDSQLTLGFRISNQNQSKSIRIEFELNDLTENDWKEMEKGFGKKFILNDSYVAFLREWETEDFISFPLQGQVTVKLIKEKNIIAGTFGFKAIDASDRELNVTFGRYDYQYVSF